MSPAPVRGAAALVGHLAWHALRTRSRHRMATAVALCAVWTWLIVLAVVARHLDQTASQVNQQGRMVVFLDRDTSAEQGRSLQRALLKTTAVTRARYVSSERARRELAEGPAGPQAWMAGVESSWIPSAIELELRPGIAESAGVTRLRERLEVFPEIDEVWFEAGESSEWLEGLQRVGFVWMIGCALMGVLILVAILRLDAEPWRRYEEVLWLQGASAIAVGAARMVYGAVLSMLGAGAGVLVAYGLFVTVATPLSRAGVPVELRFFSIGESLAIVAGAAVLAAVASARVTGEPGR